ncbi:MAG: monovalent cation/H+ antiporter complex subunit F [Actinomycetota bacterium]|nr:monovalent cation/H+ antiporter complex subunit F [Actinomycetota bacterium]
MNGWILAAIVLVIAGFVPCLVVSLRASAMEGLVALELAGNIAVLVLLLLAEGFQRQPFVDLALVLALLSFVGTLAFVRYMEREI